MKTHIEFFMYGKDFKEFFSKIANGDFSDKEIDLFLPMLMKGIFEHLWEKNKHECKVLCLVVIKYWLRLNNKRVSEAGSAEELDSKIYWELLGKEIELDRVREELERAP